jgi:RNA polymerase sigma factor (sigma-70 family)
MPSELSTSQSAFQTTHWSVILTARQRDDTTSGREALAKLCSDYWYPLYAFIRRQGASPHEAEDLTQEFFHRFLERDALRNVTPGAGKFRSFLLTCLKHFLINEREKAQAQRRGGGQAAIPLDVSNAETYYQIQPADPVTPEVLFDRQWAFTVLEQTFRHLKQEYADRKQDEMFQVLRGFLPGGGGGPSRSEIASQKGVSAGALDVAVHRLRLWVAN